MQKLVAILIFSGMLLCFACRKKDTGNVNNNPVPSVPVQITLYPNDPLMFKLQAIGGWMYVNGGVNGLVVYRKSNEEFVAVERTSSQLPDNAKARVIVLSDNFTLEDTISKSNWRIFDGTVTKGPATWPLRLYATNFDGNALRINN